MRKLVCFALPFSAAIFLAVYLLPQGALLPAGIGCAAAGAAGLAWKGGRRLRWILLCAGLAAGLAWSWVYGAVFLQPARELDGERGEIDALVTGWPQPASYGSSVQILIETDTVGLTARLYLYEEDLQLRPGDQIHLEASLRLADTMAGEETDYYLSKGISLMAYGEGELTVQRPDRPGIRHWAAYLSQALKQSIARAVPEDAAPMITALATGDRSTLPENFYSAMQRTGIAHVVAVSGMHVSFLANFVALLLGRRRRLGAGVGIGLMFCFAAVAGGTPSVLRAAFMQSMLLLAPLLGREDDRPTSLSTVLMLLLLYNPYAAASVSLQLSFTSVAGIYLITSPLYAAMTRALPASPGGLLPRLGCWAARFGAGSLATTLGALVFTTPLTVFYFSSVSLISPLANLLTLWAVSAAFLGGLFTALLGLALPNLAGAAGWLCAWPVRYIQGVITPLSRLTFSAVSTDTVYLRLWLLLVYVILGILCLSILRRQRLRPVFPVCLCAVTLAAALLANSLTLFRGGITAAVLDVGQGLSVALTSRGRTALVDCGGYQAGEIAADYFQGMAASQVDVLVLTHYHADHANGVSALLSRMPVELLVVPDVDPESELRAEILALARKEDAEVRFVTSDTSIELGDVTLQIYPPLGDGGANEEGLSVLCTAGEFDALITGDMPKSVEKLLLEYTQLPDIELLVAGHHGSKDATSQELLDALLPEHAVISVGYNSYGHPAQETINRLAVSGCAVYRTDQMGTVTVTAR